MADLIIYNICLHKLTNSSGPSRTVPMFNTDDLPTAELAIEALRKMPLARRWGDNWCAYKIAVTPTRWTLTILAEHDCNGAVIFRDLGQG